MSESCADFAVVAFCLRCSGELDQDAEFEGGRLVVTVDPCPDCQERSAELQRLREQNAALLIAAPALDVKGE